MNPTQSDAVHYGHYRKADGGWQAYCPCGWIGEPRESKSDAIVDGRRHERAAYRCPRCGRETTMPVVCSGDYHAHLPTSPVAINEVPQ